jgi:hypothetical protein
VAGAKKRAVKKRGPAAKGAATPAEVRLGRWAPVGAWVTAAPEYTGLVRVLILRRSPLGLALGLYLVDLWCTGVKNAFVRELSAAEVEELCASMPVTPCDIDLAASIVRAGQAYAEANGLPPRPEWTRTAPFLAGLPVEPREVAVGGPEGIPRYVAGPTDRASVILALLRRRLGPDGFDHVLPVDPSGIPDAVLDAMAFGDDEVEQDDDPHEHG